MISFSIVKDMILKKGFREIKVQQFGAKTADQISSFGDDSSPLKEMIAIYAETSEIGDNIVIGYINKDQISEPGEKRIFSQKEDGSLSFEIHLKNNGTCTIGPQANDHAVRYSKLEEAFNSLKSDFNTLVQIFNAHTHLSSSPGSPTSPSATQGQASMADISPAKIEEIKIL